MARTQADDDKLATALHRLQDEDPALVVDRDDETHQTLLRGMGETHLQITLERLERKFGVERRHRGRCGCPTARRSPAGAEAEGKYKKQSGGHGQFGVCTLRVEPLERGEGFEFVDKVVGGAIPRQFIPAVEKGVEETMADGGVLGFPVVDVRVTCLDGKYHPVDSSEMSFKMAGRLGFREAHGAGRAGAARAHLAARGHRARSSCRATSWATSTPAGRGSRAPRRATTASRSSSPWCRPPSCGATPSTCARCTSGRGRFTVRHDHYDVLPAHLVDERSRRAGKATEDAH